MFCPRALTSITSNFCCDETKPRKLHSLNRSNLPAFWNSAYPEPFWPHLPGSSPSLGSRDDCVPSSSGRWLSISCQFLSFFLPPQKGEFSSGSSVIGLHLFILWSTSSSGGPVYLHSFTKYLSSFSHSVVSNSFWPHGLQHARLPCLSLSPGVCSDSCLLSRWCHPTTLGLLSNLRAKALQSHPILCHLIDFWPARLL